MMSPNTYYLLVNYYRRQASTRLRGNAKLEILPLPLSTGLPCNHQGGWLEYGAMHFASPADASSVRGVDSPNASDHF